MSQASMATFGAASLEDDEEEDAVAAVGTASTTNSARTHAIPSVWERAFFAGDPPKDHPSVFGRRVVEPLSSSIGDITRLQKRKEFRPSLEDDGETSKNHLSPLCQEKTIKI